MSWRNDAEKYVDMQEGCGRKFGPFDCCTVVCGDSLKLLAKLKNSSVGAIVTDPPYGTQELMGGYGGAIGYGRQQLHKVGKGQGRTIANDRDLSVVEKSSPELFRVLKDNSWMMSFCGARTMFGMGDIYRKAQFKAYGEVVWSKRMSGLGYGAIRYSHESVLVFVKGKAPKVKSSIFSVIEAVPSREDTIERHPHEKPLRVALKLVGMTEGLVLDPFCGTGVFLVAAKTLGRHFLGFELQSHYVQDARQRLQECIAMPNKGIKKQSKFLYYEL